MAYLLENQAVAHSSTILETLQNWSEQESDVQLISNQGAVVQTHRVFLTLYSPVLNSALLNISSETTTAIFVPASTASLINLMKILSTGVSISDQKEDLLGVVNTAEMLGIFLKDIQVGTRGMPNINPSEEVEDEKNESSINLYSDNNDQKKKGSKRTKRKKEKIMENFEIKKEVYISLTVNKENTPQQEFNDQGMTIKDEQITDSNSSLYQDSRIGPDVTENRFSVDKSPPSSEASTCNECGKTFSKRDKLKRHLVIHTEDKPFQCDECESKFNRKDGLVHHKNLKHSSMEPATCSECGKTFSHMGNLTRHLVIHTDEKPFPCNKCESKFNRKDKLGLHKNAKHNENYGKNGI